MKFICCLAIFVILSAYQPTCAQDFKEAYFDPIIPGGQVAWADFDNDGDPDLLTSGVVKGGVGATIIYRNDNGRFVEISETFDGMTGSPKWLDFDNDGDLDLILRGTSQIRIFKNTNGSFSMSSFYYTSYSIWADYELDGDEDLFVRNDTGMGVLRNFGGTFQFKQLISQAPDVVSFTVADFNVDGSVDILVKRQHYNNSLQGSLRLYLYNPTTDRYEIDNSNSFEHIPYASPTSFDVDDDGDPDILFDSKLFINTAGSFSSSSDPFFQTFIRLGELDGDGVIDLLRYENYSYVYYKNERGGVYSKITNSILNEFTDISSTTYYGPSPEGFQYASISGKIPPTTNGGEWATHIYRLENGSYRNIYPNPFEQVHNAQNTWIDYNKDGLMDVNISSKLYRNTGIGFEAVYEFINGGLGRSGSWVDFNNDGNIDYITIVNRNVILYEGFQNNPPNVTSKVILYGISNDAKLQMIDFDNDKDLDIYIGDYAYYEGGMYVNSNNSLTKITNAFGNDGLLGKAEWADYDLDGDLDAAIYIHKSILGISKVYLYKKTGNSFSEVTGTPFANLRGGLCKWIDYDKDGYTDLFVYGEYYGKYYVYLYKNVAGVFTEQPTSAFTGLTDTNIDLYTTQISIVDFDLNGFPDIIINGEGDNKPVLNVYRNINGTFENYFGHGLPASWDLSLDFSDYDNDGDQDVLYTGGFGPKTQIYINQANNLNSGASAVSLFPANGQTLVYNNGFTLHIDFQEPIFKGSGSLRIYRKIDNQLLYEIQISDQAVTVSGNKATVLISDDLFDKGEKVYVLVDPKAFTNAELNAGNGILNQSIWNLTIQNNKQDQTISFPTLPSVLAGSPDLVLQATSSAGLNISYTSSNESVATINGNLVTIKDAGSTLITATSLGNAFYNSASSVSQTLTVDKVAQSITFQAVPNKKMGDDPFTLTASTSSGLDIVFSTSSARVSLVGNEVTLLQAGPATIDADQSGNWQYEAAFTVKQTFCINPQQPTISIGGSTEIATLMSSSETGNQWFKDGEIMDGETSRSLTVTKSGIYLVITTAEGCSSEPSAEQIVLITGLDNEQSKESLLFPNPATVSIVFDASSIEHPTGIEVQILDSNGRRVLELNSVNSTFEINVNSFASGLYTLKAISQSGTIVRRFVRK